MLKVLEDCQKLTAKAHCYCATHYSSQSKNSPLTRARSNKRWVTWQVGSRGLDRRREPAKAESKKAELEWEIQRLESSHRLWVILSTRKITNPGWIVTDPMDSFIQLLNNRAYV